MALQEVVPSFVVHSTLAPTFQPSPLTMCSLPSSVFTVAMPLSSILVTVPVMVCAVARVATKHSTATLRPTYLLSIRSIPCLLSQKSCSGGVSSAQEHREAKEG